MVTFDDAKRLLDSGFSIFPVHISWSEEEKKYNKKPAVEWKKYQSTFATIEELHSWFDNNNFNGIGIVTGKISNVVVVDVEAEDLEANIEKFNLSEGGRVSQTISGGRHYYYRFEEGITNTVRIEGEKIDIRGEGGFVVAPPSGVNDKKYQWIHEVDQMYLQRLPDQIKKNLNWKEVSGEKLNLTDHLQVQQGSRNDNLHRIACSLLNKYPEEEAWNIVLGINAGYQPPLPEHEVKTIFNSAFNFIKKDSFNENSNSINNTSTEKFLIGEPIVWSDIKAEDYQKQWIWENYIAKGHTTLLSALWKAGKTTFIRCLLVAMAHQEEFAGQPTYKAKTLIVSEEASEEWVDNKEMLNKEDTDNVLVWVRPIRGRATVKNWEKLIQEISDYCKNNNIDMVIIDTLTTFWPIENENDSAQVIKALVPLYSLTEDARVAVLLVHHFRKGGGDQAQASRGSGALPGFVDNIVEFTRSESGFPNQRTLKTYGRFSGVIPEVVIEYTEEEKYITKGEPWQISKSARLDKIVQTISQSKEALSAKDVFNSLARQGINITIRSVQRYLGELLEKNILKIDREETVVSRKVPYYAQTGWVESANDNYKPVPVRPVVSLASSETVVSSVVSSGENSLKPDDTTGTSVIGNEDVPF